MKQMLDKERLAALLRRNGALLLVLAAGLGLLLWPSGRGTDTAPAARETRREDTAEDYLRTLEQRLSLALSRVDGVGDATVVLTAEGGSRRELAFNERGEERETVVVSGGTGREEAVVVQESAPRLRGALVVCPGGGDDRVRLSILHAVMALTGLRANQISICQGTGGKTG